MDVIPPPQKSCLPCHLVAIFFAALALGVVCYLLRINRLLATTPAEIQRLTPTRWTRETVKETYRRLEKRPITPDSYKDQLSPRLDRRYIVTGGSGTSSSERPGTPPSLSRQMRVGLWLIRGPTGGKQVSSVDISFSTSWHADKHPRASAYWTSRNPIGGTCSPAPLPTSILYRRI